MSLLVYSASAGSGKTYTLALKYISMALMSEKPNAFASVLAVTFTNKASGEMKDRILGQLYNLTHGGLDRGFLSDVAKETKLAESEVCERARVVLYAIMHDYDHFKVETIDSFFQSLLTNMAHELRLSRGFKVDLDDNRVISMAVDRLLLTLKERGNKALIDMVTDYMDRHIDDDRGWNIARDLKAFAQSNLFCDAYTNHDEEFERLASDPRRMRLLHSGLRSYIDEVDRQLFETLSSLTICIRQWEGSRSRSLTTVANYAKEALRTGLFKAKQGATIEKVANDADALFTKKDQPTALQRSAAETISTHLQSLLSLQESHRYAYNSCKLILQNLDTLGLLGAISKEVTSLTSEEGTFLLARTPELFSRIVKGTDASFVFEKAGTTFRHIMIDEFQDTSRMQWHNFKTLLFENQAQGDESMLVGDIKQSIYRWRGGDWNILFNIKKEMPQARVEPKVDNFRSLPMIVRFNNAFFTKTALLADGKEWTPPTDWQTSSTHMMPDMPNEGTEEILKQTLIERIYKDVEQTPRSKKGTGYVRIETYDYATTTEEILGQLHDTINRLHGEQGIPYKEMLILVRRNREAADIIDYFSQADTDFELTSEQAYFYTSSGMVMSLVYLLKYIADTEDILSLTLFEQSYEALLSTLPDVGLIIHFTSCKDAVKESLSQPETLTAWAHMPLYELLQMLDSHLQFEAIERAGHTHQAAYLFDFFDAVLSFQDDHIANIPNFLTYWDETLVRHTITTNATDAIQIMTIHKAKGLEAHTVLMPFAHFSTEKDRPDTIIWCDAERSEKEQTDTLSTIFSQLPVLPISCSSSKVIQESVFAANYEEEHLQMRIDALNELYVAFTRARNNLFVWSKRPRISYKCSTFYWIDAFINNRQPSDTYGTKTAGGTSFTPTAVSYGTLEEYVAKAEEERLNPFDKPREEAVDVCLSQGGLSSVSFLQSGKAADFIADTRHLSQASSEDNDEAYQQTLKQREYINQGLLFHALFSRINTAVDVDSALSDMLREGVISTHEQASAMRKIVTKALESQPMVGRWFDGTYRLFNERSILSRNDRGLVVTSRPDRVMVGKDEAIVVDYKFGGEKNSYNYQVLGYMNHLSQLIHKPVKGYLWYVFENKIEEVTQRG